MRVLPFVAVLALTCAVACTPSSPAPAAAPPPAAPAAAAAAPAAPPPAAPSAANVDDAVRVVQAIYDEAVKYYGAAQAAGTAPPPSPAPLWERQALVSKALAAEFAKNKDNELGVLDWDPVVAGQDAQLSDVVIKGAPSSSGAIVVATFRNFGEPQEVSWHFVREDGAWKLDNVTHPKWDVRKHLAQPG